METVIFLLPISSSTSEVGLVVGSIAGILVGIAFGIFVLVVGKYFLLDPNWFFQATTLFIFFIAAGLSSYSVIELEQIAAPQLKAVNHPFFYRPVYNIGCLHETMGRVWTGVIETHCFIPESSGLHIKRITKSLTDMKKEASVCQRAVLVEKIKGQLKHAIIVGCFIVTHFGLARLR